MSDDSRFFRWLGRINALLFFVAVCALIIGMASAFVGMQFSPADMPAAAPVAKSGEDTFVFANNLIAPMPSTAGWGVTQLDDTDVAFMVLQRQNANPYSSSLSRYQRDSDVNLLLIDLKTMKSRWLLDGVHHDIGPMLKVLAQAPAPQSGPNPVTALLMPVASKDTNGDGKISAADDHALYVYRIGAKAPVKVLDARTVLGMDQLDSERIVVRYYDGKTDRLQLLSAKTFAAVADAPLPSVPR